jgi:exportin-2 (importin alpha re-exporter)
MFETIASLVRYICAATPAAVDAFEGLLFPPFQFVLQKDVSEFTPYVFQVLAQL